jgi:predicted transposase/invertase (TIGR01784 family)
LAGLKLEQDLIYRILRRDIMQESTVYRSILAEGEAKGEARKQREIALKLLKAGVAIEIIASTTGLSLETVQQLRPKES